MAAGNDFDPSTGSATCDICFVVGASQPGAPPPVVLHAHRVVLALGSPVFATWLTGPPGDKSGRMIVPVSNVAPPDFCAFLARLYGSTKAPPYAALGIGTAVKLALRYEAPRLLAQAIGFLNELPDARCGGGICVALQGVWYVDDGLRLALTRIFRRTLASGSMSPLAELRDVRDPRILHDMLAALSWHPGRGNVPTTENPTTEDAHLVLWAGADTGHVRW